MSREAHDTAERAWECREFSMGYSVIERGTGDATERLLATPLLYDDACIVEALTARVERLEAVVRAAVETFDDFALALPAIGHNLMGEAARIASEASSAVLAEGAVERLGADRGAMADVVHAARVYQLTRAGAGGTPEEREAFLRLDAALVDLYAPSHDVLAEGATGRDQ